MAKAGGGGRGGGGAGASGGAAGSASSRGGSSGKSVQSFAARRYQQSIQRNNVPYRRTQGSTSVQQFQQRLNSGTAPRDETGFPRSDQLAQAKKEMQRSGSVQGAGASQNKSQADFYADKQGRVFTDRQQMEQAANKKSQRQSQQKSQQKSEADFYADKRGRVFTDRQQMESTKKQEVQRGASAERFRTAQSQQQQRSQTRSRSQDRGMSR